MSQDYLRRARTATRTVTETEQIPGSTSEQREKCELSPPDALLTGEALTDAVFAKLATVPEFIREQINDLLWWAGEPERTADELRAAGLPEDFEGVCRWVLTASPLEVPRAMMRANAYPEKYQFADGYGPEGPLTGVTPR